MGGSRPPSGLAYAGNIAQLSGQGSGARQCCASWPSTFDRCARHAAAASAGAARLRVGCVARRPTPPPPPPPAAPRQAPQCFPRSPSITSVPDDAAYGHRQKCGGWPRWGAGVSEGARREAVGVARNGRRHAADRLQEAAAQRCREQGPGAQRLRGAKADDVMRHGHGKSSRFREAPKPRTPLPAPAGRRRGVPEVHTARTT